MEEQQAVSDGGGEEHKSLPRSELVESKFEKNQVVESVVLKASSSSTPGNDVAPDATVVSTDNGDDMNLSSAGTVEAKDGSTNDEFEKLNAPEDTMIQQSAEEEDPGNSGGGDLLALSRFAKVPIRTRSSLTTRGLKVDPVLIVEDDPNESELSKESGGHVEDVWKDVSLADASLNQSPRLKSKEPLEESVEQDARQLGLEYKVGQGLCSRSKSFPERLLTSEVQPSEGELGLGRSSSMIVERGEKRALQQSDSWEGAKRVREWNPSDSHEEMPSIEEPILDADQQKMMDISMFPSSGNDPCIEHAEEKQLFPGSFKICDLNLMESSDVHGNHDTHPVIMFQPIPQIKKEDNPVDIDLSMSSNGNSNDKNSMRGADGKEVEVIDLESDAVQEDNTYNNTEHRDETVFTGLESFPEQAQNVNEIPDGQDGYGLMISELLGADIPNCSPVQRDINSLHNEMGMDNEMGMHNEEGILGDDDSIYMSLGEIPISMPEI